MLDTIRYLCREKKDIDRKATKAFNKETGDGKYLVDIVEETEKARAEAAATREL